MSSDSFLDDDSGAYASKYSISLGSVNYLYDSTLNATEQSVTCSSTTDFDYISFENSSDIAVDHVMDKINDLGNDAIREIILASLKVGFILIN